MDVSIDEFLYSTDFGVDTDLLDSSSSSEDECTECYCNGGKKQNVTVSENEYGMVESCLDPFASTLTDLEFRKKFRVNRNTFQKIVELCGSQFFSSMDNLCEQIAPIDAVYILLWYLGNLETVEEMSKQIKIAECCIWNIIDSGITYLSTNLRQYIEWPKSYEYPELLQSFQKVSNLKNVIGVLGTTIVKIQPPRDHPEIFLCNHDCSCLTIQGIISFNSKFMDIFLSDSCKPADIWKKSPISLEANFGLFDKGFVLGSDAYQGVNSIVTSFPQDEILTAEQRKFNNVLNTSLRLVTKSFSHLKGRFQRLQDELEYKNLSFAIKSIQTACILHNVCINNEDDCEFMFQDEQYDLGCDKLESSNNKTSRLVLFKSFLH